MESFDPSIVSTLREMASGNEVPSAMLRYLVTILPKECSDRTRWVRYFAEAFCFREGEGYPIFGWQPDGSGELQDVDIDCFLTPRISKMREWWAGAGV